MKVALEIPDYDKNDGLSYHWENNFLIKTAYINGEFLLQANKAALVSLAIQFLTLAQNNVEPGAHFHYDNYGSLEDGSIDIVVEKI